MRTAIMTQSGVGKSTPVSLDICRNPFSVSIGCVVTGSATYSIEYSYDDPFAKYATDYGTNATWWTLSSISAKSAAADAALSAPVRAIRINQTVGAGTVTATVIQSGTP